MHRSSQRSSLLLLHAAQMRSSLSWSEAALWRALSGCKLDGVQFRRQVPIAGRFIVDFLAPREKLIVEVDGGCHRALRVRDERRDRVLRRLGYRVLRLEAELVVRSLPEALGRVREALALHNN